MKDLLIQTIKNEAKRELARRRFINFVLYTKKDYDAQWFHILLCEYLQKFAVGDIKKLMIFLPPQHGKSQLVSRHLPAYILGNNPKAKIIGCSYSSILSGQFNRDIKRIITTNEYGELFPKTRINSKNVSTDARGGWLNNGDIFEVVDYGGFYKNVGIGGSLTGTPSDVAIIDDPVKDAAQADSPTIRSKIWDWYEGVFLSRLHNQSRILLTMTRWHTDDLAGTILKSQDAKNWEILKLPAIKTNVNHHPSDNRKIGEALWENRHSAEKIKSNSERVFEALYQQNPMPPKGGLVFPNVVIVDKMPSNLNKLGIGIDFGYQNDPTAVVMGGVDKATKSIYLDQLLYETHYQTLGLIGLLKQYKGMEVFCDNDNRIIDQFKDAGINAKAVKKWSGSIISGIHLMNDYNIHITKRSFGGISESTKYVYKTDGFGAPTNDPVDYYNHFWDAARYWAQTALAKPEKGILGTF